MYLKYLCLNDTWFSFCSMCCWSQTLTGKEVSRHVVKIVKSFIGLLAAQDQISQIILLHENGYHCFDHEPDMDNAILCVFNFYTQCTARCLQLSIELTRSRPKLNYGAGRDFGVGPEFGATPKQPIIPENLQARSCAGEEDGQEDRVMWLDLRPG